MGVYIFDVAVVRALTEIETAKPNLVRAEQTLERW